MRPLLVGLGLSTDGLVVNEEITPLAYSRWIEAELHSSQFFHDLLMPIHRQPSILSVAVSTKNHN
jgi:hypothetical protein